MKTKMQTSVIKKTLLLTLMLVTGSAFAEWVKVTEAANANFYIDVDTIRKDGDLRKVWALADLKQRGKDDEISTRTRFEFDCKEDRRRNLSSSTHSAPMANGTTLTQLNEVGAWRDVAPNTVYAGILKMVCAR